jgi:hypothetical protein
MIKKLKNGLFASAADNKIVIWNSDGEVKEAFDLPGDDKFDFLLNDKT